MLVARRVVGKKQMDIHLSQLLSINFEASNNIRWPKSPNGLEHFTDRGCYHFLSAGFGTEEKHFMLEVAC